MKEPSAKSENTGLKLTSVHTYARNIADTIHEPVLILKENGVAIAANDQFYSSFKTAQEHIIGRTLSEFGTPEGDFSSLQPLLEKVLPEKERFKDFEFRYDPYENLVFLVNGSLLPGEKPQRGLVLLSFTRTSKEAGAWSRNREDLKSFNDILAHAPAMICTLRGPKHIFELANERYYQLVGNRNIIGKPVRKALPEIENQGFFEILDEVYKTGEPFVGNEVFIQLDTGEESLKNSYLDFLYQPTWDESGKVDGIFVHAVDVTEQVLARKKVEENEKKLRQVIDTVPAIIWISDKNGGNSYLNKNWYEYTGQKKEEGEALGWLITTHPEDRERVEETVMKANEARKAFSISYRLRNKNGGYRWVINRGRCKFDVNGGYEGMIGTVVDVDEEKKKEQLIREKEHRIRSIVEEATVATAVYTGKDLTIEMANDAMIGVWGKDRSVVGTSLRKALPELEGQPFFDLLQEVYDTGKTYWGKEDRVDLMVENQMKTGYFNFTYKPLRNEEGEIYGILNMAVDVSEIVQSKALLRESEVRFRQMADLMPEKVANTDAGGNFIYFNQGWLEYTGRSSEELKEEGWPQYIHPEEKDEFVKGWRRSLESGMDFEMELRCRQKNGKYIWHLNRAEAVKDEAGNIKMWIGTTTEIQKLKEEEKRKEDFLKMVSHELKTPVTSIKGYVQLLLTLISKEGNEDVSSLPLTPSLKRIDNQINRLTRLIAEMLDLSRIEENKLELQKETFSINDLVADTVQDINYTNTQHQINITNKVFCKVHADKDRLGQVIINFITNAIKYSPNSKIIEVKVENSGKDQVSVRVKDYGIGIDKKNIKKVFKRFYRVDGKNEETYSGFGIGLFLAREIIERHDGKVSVTSKKGKGSVFSFSLSVASEGENK